MKSHVLLSALFLGFVGVQLQGKMHHYMDDSSYANANNGYADRHNGHMSSYKNKHHTNKYNKHMDKHSRVEHMGHKYSTTSYGTYE